MLSAEQQLALISKAWGKQVGYCFFPWISGGAKNREERIRSYHEGEAFRWPKDKERILEHMRAHVDDDLYWCPSLFERRRRQMELAMDEHALWADLDEVDPRDIQDFPPTIAWETSPGRYQALWIVTGGDMQGASWQGGENQRLTYYLGADSGGWDTTQLLRIPEWKNYKFDHRGGTRDGHEELGPPPQGKLLWSNGRRYLPDDFEDLPDVGQPGVVQTILEDEIEKIDRHEVYGRVRLKLPRTARELFSAREASGDRSERLWWMMRCLADAGCSAPEIVALVRPTVWNKFSGRQDEVKRLTLEASKAVATREDKPTSDELELEHEPREKPQRLSLLLQGVKDPKWLVQELWSEGACGFIAGQPKSFKSWIALDLALSISTGLPFLDAFPVRLPGPVLYIQEEDSLPMVKGRFDKVWPGKKADKMRFVDGELTWNPAEESSDDPDIAAHIGNGFVISDPGWQSWLDEVLDDGLDGEPYRMVLLDPLMMIAGEVEETRAQDMTEKIFKPLKQLARKHTVAVAVVHHMRKGDPARPTRGGQLMLGSVANHAWSEDSLYLKMSRGGDVTVERESKHTTSGSFRISRLRNKGWTPTVVDDKLNEWAGDNDPRDSEGPRTERRRSNGKVPGGKAIQAFKELGPGPHKTSVVAEQMGISPSGAHKQLMRLAERGLIERVAGGLWTNGNK